MQEDGASSAPLAGEPTARPACAGDTDPAQHRVQQALRENEELYRTLIDSIDQGFCVFEMIFDDEGKAVDYRFVEVNAAFEQQTGLADAQGKRMRELEPDHEEYWFEIYGRVALTGESVRFENAATRLHRWFEVYAFRFGRPEDHKVAALFRDVTGRREAEEVRARLAAIVESSDDAIISKDLRGIMRTWNRAAERLFGYTAEEAIGRSVTMLMPPDRVAEEDEILARISRGERIEHFETVRRHKDGTLLDISLTISPIIDAHGQIVGASKIARDNTERREAEEVRKKRELERALEEQLAATRRRLGRELHDGLRQELVGVQMLSASLTKKLEARNAPEAALMQEFSRIIGDANNQVRQLINGLVPARVEADSLQSALERSAEHIEQWYGLLCSVSCNEPIVLPDDQTANHLFHITQEAMTNAAKHAKANQIDVRLALRQDALLVEVRDDGRGMPEDYEKRGGMGISNLRGRAELIGARLDIRSDQASGTVISCCLPLALPPNAKSA